MDLKEFFEKHPRVALAYSGGTDSSYLMYEAVRNGADIIAYFVKSQFQPEFEMADAVLFAKNLNVKLKIIECDVLNDPDIVANSEQRCYFCKKKIFSVIMTAASADCRITIDGTNASDDPSERPGMRALSELSVLSPLRECGLSKDEIRKRSEYAELNTWHKPSYSCLATRIPVNNPITEDSLKRIENSEKILFSMGFEDFRLRHNGSSAVLCVRNSQMQKAEELLQTIRSSLSEQYENISLELR